MREGQNQPTLPDTNALSLLGVKILVVDDDADSRDFVTFVLEQDGADVMGVASALEALQAVAEAKPDVLVSDIGMPNMDGYTLMRQLRTWTPEQGGQIPAIALTAFASKSDQQQAITVGFQMHLPKPLNAEALVQAIVRLIATDRTEKY
jgi:CheY-like chemotaxis protein